jgi:ABC-type transporter Mla maintaining outer membrane lipid asymmetry ATPase subunit MlaF
MIRLVKLNKSFRGAPVLKDLNLTIPTGETTVIIGGSGSGKRVLLKHIIGLLQPDSGEGTLGKLVNDDGLYKEAKYAIRSVTKATEGFQKQIPVSIFGTIIGTIIK